MVCIQIFKVSDDHMLSSFYFEKNHLKEYINFNIYFHKKIVFSVLIVTNSKFKIFGISHDYKFYL